MSAGGARFNLGLAVDEFKAQWAQAQAVATTGAAGIGDTLNSISGNATKAAQDIKAQIDRALGRGGAADTMAQLQDAAKSVDEALTAIGRGDTVAGFEHLQQVALQAEAALALVDAAAEKTRTTLGAAKFTSDVNAARQALASLAQQATALNSIGDTVARLTSSSSATLGRDQASRDADERQQAEAAANAIRKMGLEYAKEAERQIAAQREQDEIAARAIRSMTLEYVKETERQAAADAKERDALDKANEEFIARNHREDESRRIAAERQRADFEQANERYIERMRREDEATALRAQREADATREAALRQYNQEVIDNLRAQRQQENAANAPGVGGEIGGALLTGLGIGSGAQVAFTALNKVQELLGVVKQGVIDFNDQLDRSTIAWTVFTGSAEKAAAQVQTIFDFSKKTPFTFQDVDAAARQLAAFGGAALASEQNLRLLGDVAAGTQKDLSQITYEFGALYTEIENGLPFGRAARALVQFGALSGDTRVRLEEMQKAGASVDDMLKVLYDDLGRFSGNLDKQSKTWSGALTTLKNQLDALAASAGRPLFDKIRDDLNSVVKMLESDTAQQWANRIAKELLGVVFVLETIINSVKIMGNTFAAGFDEIVALTAAKILDMVHILNVITKGAFNDQEAALRTFVTNAQGMANAAADGANKSIDDIRNSWARLGDDLGKVDTPKAQKAGQDYGAAWMDGVKSAINSQASANEITQLFAGLGQSRDLLGNFSKSDMDQLNNLSTVVEDAIMGAKVKGKITRDAQELMLELRPILIQGVEDIRTAGEVSDATKAKLAGMLPPEALAAVNEYFDAITNLKGATLNYATAVDAAKSANNEYIKTQKEAKDAVGEAQKAYDAAQRTAEINAANAQRGIDAVNDHIHSLQDEAHKVARGWDDYLANLKDGLDALRATADENTHKFEAMLEPLKQRTTELQDIEKEHADAYKAILAGTTQEYLAQNTILDEQTRKIVEKWEAEIGGKRRAMEGADQKVSSLEVKERADLLAIDEKIRAARANHNNAEVAALTEQRKKIEDRAKYQLDIERERAGVAKDGYDAAAKGIDKEAAAQATKDKKAIADNKAQIDAIEAQAKAQKDKDDAAIKAQEQYIRDQTRLAANIKRDYDDQIQQLQDQANTLEQQKKIQADKDKQQTDAAKDHLQEVKDFWDVQVTRALAWKTAADQAAASAKTEMDNAKETTNSIKERLTYIQQENQLYLDRINAQRVANGLPPLTWAQIAAGTSGLPANGPGPGGIGEGRGPQGPYEGPPTPWTPSTGQPVNEVPKTPPTSHPDSFVDQPGRLSALSLPAAYRPAANAGIAATSMVATSSVTIGAVHLFPDAQFSSEIDVENASRIAGQTFLAEIRKEGQSGGPATRIIG